MLRIHLLLILIFFSLTSYSQDANKELDSLKVLASEIEVQIKPLQEELDELNEEIRILKIKIEQHNKQNLFDNGIATATTTSFSLKKSPEFNGEILIEIPSNTNVTVHEIKGGYYYIKYNGILGWALRFFFKDNPELDKMNKTLNSIHKIGSSSTQKSYSNSSLKDTKNPNYSYGKTWVKGHYRKVNGKKIWVKGHYRNK